MTSFIPLCAVPPSSASHIAQAHPAGAQSWLGLEECVQRRLDRAAHTDGLQTAGIHKVSQHPPGVNIKHAMHRWIELQM